MKYTDVRSYSWYSRRRQRYVRFDQATDDQLREWLKPIGPKVGRRQLLALAQNRWGDGYIEIEEFTNFGDNLGGPAITITETAVSTRNLTKPRSSSGLLHIGLDYPMPSRVK